MEGYENLGQSKECEFGIIDLGALILDTMIPN